MKRTDKDHWKQFEQQVAVKRTGTKKRSHIVLKDLVVKRMSPLAEWKSTNLLIREILFRLLTFTNYHWKI